MRNRSVPAVYTSRWVTTRADKRRWWEIATASVAARLMVDIYFENVMRSTRMPSTSSKSSMYLGGRGAPFELRP